MNYLALNSNLCNMLVLENNINTDQRFNRHDFG